MWRLSRTAALALSTGLAGCGLTAIGAEAPPGCGFPEGTPLSFAGRTTTDALGVSEAPGTAMAKAPADIYITRDAFAQGELRGRLVCAIFVEPAGFVEVTVHPDDGGGVEPVEPTPGPTRPPDGIAESDVTELAAAELPDGEEWELFGAAPMTVAELATGRESEAWLRGLEPGRWVWLVQFAHDDVAFDVYLDYLDGSVLGTSRYIFN